MTELTTGFVGVPSQEFVEFCVCAGIFTLGVASWIAWYTFSKD